MKPHSFYNLIFFRIQLAGCFLFFSFTVFSQQTLRTNLFVVGADGSKTLMDGNMTIYDDIYCNCVNWEDALKMSNPGENWGLVRSGISLAVERRKFIPETDTTYIRMWNLQQRNFAIEVIGHNLAETDRIAYVRDNYTNSTTAINLSGTTYVDFTVNSNSGSSTQNRFSIIFAKKAPIPPPVKFTDVKLFRKDAFVNVEFAVDDEKVVSLYSIQVAKDTLSFKDVKSITPKNLGGSEVYSEDAGTCNIGENYYRIRAVDAIGRITYSSVAKLILPVAEPSMNIYPNPSTSRQLFLHIAIVREGRYQVRALGLNGNVYQLGSLQLSGFKITQPIRLPDNITPGMYKVQLIGPGNTVIIKTVTLL